MTDALHRAHPTELHRYHRNARRGNVAAIKASLVRLHQYKPITVNVGTHTGRPMEVLAGNHTLDAIRELLEQFPDQPQWREVLHHLVDVDDETAARIVLADNRTAELGTMDNDVLLAQLASLPDLDGTGYTPADLLAMGGDGDLPVLGDPDEVPERSGPGRASEGQVWRLGQHRLAVGDSRDPALLDALMLELGPADGIVTDPPYGVSYSSAAGKIQNDELRSDELRTFIGEALKAGGKHLPPGRPWYVFGPSGPPQLEFRLALQDIGWQLRSECVWVKDALVLGGQDYHAKHESVLTGGGDPDTEGWAAPVSEHEVALYGWVPGAHHVWLGDRKQTTVWEFPRPRSSKSHPTMKPAELIAAILRNSVPPQGVVLDLFAGSGSIMAAAQMTNRRAAMVELDPVYAEVILSRYTALSGGVPELVVAPKK